MSRSMRRRDFLIATGVAGTACLPTPSVRAFGGLQAATADLSFHVYLAFWQSNMEGFRALKRGTRRTTVNATVIPVAASAGFLWPVNYRRYGCG
jgi:hypothetical protein